MIRSMGSRGYDHGSCAARAATFANWYELDYGLSVFRDNNGLRFGLNLVHDGQAFGLADSRGNGFEWF